MTFEIDLYNQVHTAASLFERAQRSFNGCSDEGSASNNSNTSGSNHQQILDEANQSLSIYRNVQSLLKRARNKSNNSSGRNNNKAERRCINLELRMATILRFLATVSTHDKSVEGVQSAIRYQDEAVSLLVGVFDTGVNDGDNDGSGADNELNETIDLDELHIGGDVLPKNNNDTSDDDFTQEDDGILYTINVSLKNNLPISLQFVTPTENQRVRAIAASLNSLASLHALLNDDRSAMDSYREALEILRAATEEASEESKDEEGKSVIELDLAETLMNVGTFHLRRDELDAALNAYSTVFALYSGEEKREEVEPKHMLPSLNSPKSSRGSGVSSPRALLALNNLGIVHERRGELGKAYECYNQVRLARQNFFGEDSIEVADAWINLGNCLQRQLEWKEAKSVYEKAVNIYQKKLMDKMPVPMVGRISRALSGALRNHGTCCWKQRKLADAIDQFRDAITVEDGVVARLSSEVGALGAEDAIYQAKLSMAQLLGIMGCLYLEHSSTEAKLLEKSKASFQQAIQIYIELGFTSAHPSIVWARTNLDAVGVLEEKTNQVPPPPPPPLPPKKKSPLSPSSVSSVERPDLVSRGVSDQAAFTVLETPGDVKRGTPDKTEGDSVFLGVEDYQSSTDELDEILSEKVEIITKSVKEKLLLNEKNLSHDSPFDEEAGFGNTNTKQKPEGLVVNSPLSSKHRNTSYTSFTETPDKNEGTEREEELRNELDKSYEHFGDESSEVAHAHLNLAKAFWQRGDRVNATEHYTIAHSIFEYKLGDSESCAIVLKALGDLNKEDEKYEAASELYDEAMEIEMSVHGHCLPSTLNAAGVVCLLEDDHRAAMEFHRRALQIQQKSLGEGNKYQIYETLVLIGNVYYSERNNLSNIRSKGVDYKEFIELGFLGWIANAHDMRGEYVKACQFYEESLQININKKRNESKKETALTLNRLGSLNRELGRYEEAIDYHQRAMKLQQSNSNSAKAMTAETCVLMAMVKAKMGDYNIALALLEDSLIVLKASLGDTHLSVAKTMAQIGAVFLELSNYDKAMSILLKAEEYQLAAVGEYHRDTFETQTLLGRLRSAVGDFDRALVQLHGVAEKQIQMFGDNHPSIADTNQYIGECFLNQGMVAEARQMFVDCYNMRKKFFSLDQLTIAESMVDIIRARNGRPERSLAIYRNAMEIYKEYLPDTHVQIGHLLVYEGDVHAELLDFAKAVDRYQKANNIFLKAVGERHIVEADVLVNIGQVLLRKCDYDGAKEQFCTALEIYSTKLPDGHRKIATAAQHLKRVEQEEALCV